MNERMNEYMYRDDQFMLIHCPLYSGNMSDRIQVILIHIPLFLDFGFTLWKLYYPQCYFQWLELLFLSLDIDLIMT